MRIPIMLVLAVVLTVAGVAQTRVQPSVSTPTGASAIWHPPNGFLASAKGVCSKPGNPPLEVCLIGQMTKAGAPPDAVHFTRVLYKLTAEIGFMSAFHKVGPVDIAWVMYPLRSSNTYGLMLVNGQPSVVNAEDIKSLDEKGLEQSFQFQDLKNQFPKAGLWPGDRDGKTWPNSQTGPHGGLQFVIGYPLRNGCATCAHAGYALFTWNFDSSGKFEGTTFMGMTPAPLN